MLRHFRLHLLASALFVALCAASLFFASRYINSTQQVADSALPNEVPADWWETVKQDIASSEYNISKSDAGHFQSPNRQQQLRFHYSPLGFVAEPRDKSAGNNWCAKMQLKSIGRQNSISLVPSETARINAAGGQLHYHHSGFTVEYLNDNSGMRQNFVVEKRPKGTGPLEVRIEVETPGKASLAGPSELVLSDHANQPLLRYNDLKVWDANGTPIDAWMEFDQQTAVLKLIVNDEEAAYPLTIDPLSTSGDWVADSGQASANFGWEVASAGDVNGDGYSDIIVGAYRYDNGQINEGLVAVYHGSSTGPATSASWTAESDQANAQFGISVCTAGDVNGDRYSDVIIGAYQYDNGQSNEGRAYVYHGSAAGLSGSADWTAEPDQANAQFGISVSTVGDINGDGYSDVVVGAYLYDNGQSDEGAAFVYHGSASGLNTTADWTGEGNQASSGYGRSVAAAGDVNGDGFFDLIVGARFYDNGESNEGRAFVYHGSAGGLSGTADWTTESNQASAQMGLSVSTAGDVNGDGYTDVIVGAHLYDNGHTDEGRVFVYHGSGAGLSGTADWTAESDQTTAYLGRSVATAGDVNGDGYADVIVGAHGFTGGTSNEGAAFVFEGSATGLSLTADWSVSSGQSSSNFGTSVSSAGDVNGDGFSDVVVGAPTNDNPTLDEGKSFAYFGSQDGLTTSVAWSKEADQDDAEFGFSIAAAGDVNQDGFDDIIIGAPLYDNGQADEGRAFVYHGSSSGPSATADWTAESDQAGAQFGYSVSLAGDVNGDGFMDVIVGAPFYSNGNTDEGAAFVYHGSGTGLSGTADWSSESGQDNAHHGWSVAGAGDVNSDGYFDVIVGAKDYDNGQSDEGVAFVYHGSGGGLSGTPDWTGEANQASSSYGVSVSSAGDVNGDGFADVIVGANNFSNGQSNEGRAFAYHGSATGLSATADWNSESDQASANYGISVSRAGDVDGDGYFDVIVGADMYDNGQSNEGAAFVFHGSAGGLSGTADWSTESNQADAHYGVCVSSASDVNADGYSDVIVGADDYDNGESNEGQAFVYYGGETGLSGTADWTIDSDQADAGLGISVAGVGDVDGDQFSDIMVGAQNYDNGNTNEGIAQLFSGNAGPTRSGYFKFYDIDLTNPLSASSFADPQFGIAVFATSPMGRSRGGLRWESRAEGSGFSTGSPITNSTSFTDEDITFTDFTLTGAEMTALVAKIGIATKVRARVRIEPAVAIDGRVLSGWHYPQPFLFGVNPGPLPVTLTELDATYEAQQHLVNVEWHTASEINNRGFEVQRSSNGKTFATIGFVEGAGTTSTGQSYLFVDRDPGQGIVYYRLKQLDFDHKTELSNIVAVHIADGIGSLNIGPNPASTTLAVEQSELSNATIAILSSDGSLVRQLRSNHDKVQIDVQDLPQGVYFLMIDNGNQKQIKRFVVQH